MSKKIIGITVGTQLPKPNFKQTDPTKGDYIKNKPDFDGLKSRVVDVEDALTSIIDPTLSIEGKAADAKATGDAISSVSELVGDVAVATQIAEAIASIPQADLAQNDPDAPDYVKNRTHWEEGVILPETELTYVEAAGGYIGNIQSLPEEGKKYVVTYNGTAYDCACWMWEIDPGDFAPAFGNSSLVGVEGGNADAPFLIMLGEDEAGILQCVFVLTDDTTPESVTLSIVEKDAPVHKLAPKFLPDTVIMAEPLVMEKVILPETELKTDTVTPDVGGVYLIMNTAFENVPTDGATGRLVWGGVEYTSKIVDVSTVAELPEGSFFAMGNFALDGQPPEGIENPAPNAPYMLTMIPAGHTDDVSGITVYGQMLSQGITPEIPTLSIISVDITPKQLVTDLTGKPMWEDRTHYAYSNKEETVVLEQQELTGNKPVNLFNIIAPFTLTAGEIYVVTIDGVDYRYKAAIAHNGLPCLGDGNIYETQVSNADGTYLDVGDAGAPFFINTTAPAIAELTNCYGNIHITEAVKNLTLSIMIKKDEEFVKKLDPKFMHETVVMAERPELTSEVVVLPEMELTLASDETMIPTAPNAKPEVGSVCTVTYNGTAYDCPAVAFAIDGMAGVALGNSDAIGLPGGNATAPVVVLLFDAPMDVDGSLAYGMLVTIGEITEGTIVTLSVVQTKEVIPQQLVMDKDGNIKWEDRTHWVEGGTYDVLPEATYTDDASIEAGMATPLSHALVAGEVYQVNYNGTIYKCTCISVTESGITIPVLGNTDMMSIPGGNPDAPFVFMEIPRGIPDAPENMYWQLLSIDDGSYPLTFGIKYEGEIVHKIDNKFLDIALSNWNALPGTPGYIENRTHYCDRVVMTFDPTKLAGVDTLTVDFGSGNPITFYKIGDYALDAAALKSSSYTVTALSTGEQSTTTVTVAQDNNGVSTGMAPAFFIYSINDLAAASESGVVAPSTGTYIVVISEEACAVTVDAGEILKKLDEKYLPDNAINMVNSVNGQTGEVVLTAADIGAVADTLNIENGAKDNSLQTRNRAVALGASAVALGDAYAGSEYAFAFGPLSRIGHLHVTGKGGAVTYSASTNMVADWGVNCLSYDGVGAARILKVELADDGTYTYTLSKTLSLNDIDRYVYACRQTSAIAPSSCAIGMSAIARGNDSYSQGYATTANRRYGIAIGKYNIDNDIYDGYYAQEEISERSFAFTSTYYVGDPSVDLQTGDITYGNRTQKTGSELAIGDRFSGDSGIGYKSYIELLEFLGEGTGAKRFRVRIVYIRQYTATEGTYAVMLGNGTSSTSRSNAHAIDWDGNAYFAGDVYVQGDGTTFEFDGKKKLVTEEYVNSVVSGITYESIGAEKVGAADEALVEAKAYTDSKIPTPEDALALMIEMGFVDPVADETGAMYTDDNGKIFTY